MKNIGIGRLSIVVGTLLDLFGLYLTYTPANMIWNINASTAWWILVLGTAIWIYGDYKIGAYKHIF
jgi:hypothetical protein